MAKILVTGGTGLIGKTLIPKLIEKEHKVSILSRTLKEIENVDVFKWNIASGEIDHKAFQNLDYIIHLAGAGVADKRWTDKRKKEIIDSRVNSTKLLLQKVKEYDIKLKGFISASAIGYYGAISSDQEFKETNKPHNDFLGTVCRLWEEGVLQFNQIGIPTTIFRTGIVLSNNGGALGKMKTPIITPIGSGKQWVPWIHIEDMCKMYLEAVDQKLIGTFNAVAPEHQTNEAFSKKLAKSLNRLFLPVGVPRFMLKLLFGELSVILLNGSRISSDKLVKHKYEFVFPELKAALKNLTQK